MRRLLRPLPSILLVAACVATAAVTSAQTPTDDPPAGQSGNPHSGDATIQSGGVTRLKWKADGTVEGNTSALVGVFNVRHFGAKGDGKADDTAAVTNAIRAVTAAGGGTLYFPKGIYKTSGGFVFNVPVIVRGDGMNEPIETTTEGSLSRVNCTSATAVLFTFRAAYSKVQDIMLLNTAPTTPTAGAGIVATHASMSWNKVDYDSVLVAKFYDNVDSQVGAAWSMRNCVILGPVRYGLRIRNLIHPDSGDWSVSDTVFSNSSYPASDAIRIESSGGGKITNVKINGVIGDARKQFDKGIDATMTTPGSTSTLLISNTSIENVRSHGIYVEDWFNVKISGVEVGLYGNPLSHIIYLKNVQDSTVGEVVAQNNTTANIAMKFEDCSRISLGNHSIRDYNYPVTFAGTYTASGGTSKFNPVISEFTGGWKNTGGAATPASYAYLNGVVYLKGHVSGGGINTTIMTLPAGPWRPTTARVFTVYNNGASCSITVNTNGTVVQGDGASNMNVSLDGVSYIP